MTATPEVLDPDSIALFLDVDGTLLDICDTPSAVTADDALNNVLKSCFEILGGAMALISGRSVAEIDRIFSPEVFPAAGAHGAEIRANGLPFNGSKNKSLPESAIAELESFAAQHDGVLLEMKRGGASLHYRLAPEAELPSRQLASDLLRDLGESYRLIAGKKVFELAPADHNKGAAISAFLEVAPFRGRRPVFIGDDVTDEDGFIIVNDLAGVSIRVGGAGQTAASYSLRDTMAVREWLQRTILDSSESHKQGNTTL